MARTRSSKLLAIIALAFAPGIAQAQQWGQVSAPKWGQYGPPAWGQYSNNLGVTWQYNRVIAAPEPQGAILNPNQTASNFANPSTGGSLFTPPDTHFKGRDRP
jgi:hypothetical protein